ncbi:hypothetical protein QBC35DRAFT_538048 [Podospora australis]|uniref:protein-ribulosamine 3-kinase n=1 Tax=Podospora australis TaxID=1536484 RepID=A0AAN6WNA6_9PEZI|nr:hypothetical protein QBC35DRAFT_538048 [Podospora australis]
MLPFLVMAEIESGKDNTIQLYRAVLENLPAGCRIISTTKHGVSFFAKTGHIDVELKDGTPKSFFIKLLSGATGAKMVEAEFESMKAIHAVAPDFVPEPVAYGSYHSMPDTHFFLCEFRDVIEGQLPDPGEFTAKLASLHQESLSPTGKFGFHITTYAGNLPQMVDWEDSWERFFSKSLRHALDLEMKVKGSNPKLDELVPVLFDKVIPRLLRPLESEGRLVKPSLVHGDLWYANSGVDAGTSRSVVFDACCFYAHNEYEFGQWKPSCNKLTKDM